MPKSRPPPAIVILGRARLRLSARLDALRAARAAGGRVDADELAALERLAEARR